MSYLGNDLKKGVGVIPKPIWECNNNYCIETKYRLGDGGVIASDSKGVCAGLTVEWIKNLLEGVAPSESEPLLHRGMFFQHTFDWALQRADAADSPPSPSDGVSISAARASEWKREAIGSHGRYTHAVYGPTRLGMPRPPEKVFGKPPGFIDNFFEVAELRSPDNWRFENVMSAAKLIYDFKTDGAFFIRIPKHAVGAAKQGGDVLFFDANFGCYQGLSESSLQSLLLRAHRAILAGYGDIEVFSAVLKSKDRWGKAKSFPDRPKPSP